MNSTYVRILLVLAPLALWMVSRIPMDGVATAASRPNGRDIFLQNCAKCHVSGVAQAPRISNHLEWEQRLVAGRQSLLNSVLRGKGGMPPKGGNASITDEQAIAAADYIVSLVIDHEGESQTAR